MGTHGKGPLRIAIEDFIETSPVFGFIGNRISEAIEWMEASIRNAFAGFIDRFLANADIDPETREEILSILSGEHQGGITALAGFGSQLGMSAASGIMAPFMRQINYAGNTLTPYLLLRTTLWALQLPIRLWN